MYLLLEDFKYGKDSRKFMLNSPAGTLTDLTNAHITPGGEIEKRKAFTRTALPTNSFGLEVTSSGFVVFGSVVEGSLNASLPSGVTYQRLQHPDGTTAMTEVVNSTVFNGKAFVIATFGTSGTFAFYDGTLVYDFFAGRATAWLSTNEALANHLAALVNQSADYSSSSASLVSGSDYKVVITSPSGISNEPTAQETAASGSLSAVTSRTQVDGIVGVNAQGQFSIVAGYVGAGSSVTSVLVGTSELLGAGVDYVTNNDTTAAAVKDAINGRQSVAVATTNRQRAANVATLTVVGHKFIVGDIVAIAGLGGTGYNTASATITAKTATTISYANTGGNESITGDTGGTITMVTRLFSAAVDGNVVQIIASATGVAVNDQTVSVTTTANGDGGICVDSYSFTLAMNSGAAGSGGAVPQISSIYINGVEVMGSAATGADTAAVVASAAAKVIASGTAGYTAAAVGNTLYISRLATNSSSLPLTIIIIVDSQGGVVTGAADTMVVTPGPTNLTLLSPSAASDSAGDLVTNFVGGIAVYANVSGGIPPYTYKWTPVEPNDPISGLPDVSVSGNTTQGGFTASSPTSTVPKVEFLGAGGTVDATVRSPLVKITRQSAFVSHKRIYPGYLRCTVTDSTPGKPKVASADLFTTFRFYPYA